MYCYACDTRNPDDARFCVICGQSLHPDKAPAQTVPAPTYVPSASTPKLGAAAHADSIVPNFQMNAALQPIAQIQPPLLNLLIRVIWFVFIGLWLGQVWLICAWLLNLTIIGSPIGLWMLNRMPQVMTLCPQPSIPPTTPTQHIKPSRYSSSVPFVVRVVYFVFIGWWLSLLWLQIAWVFSATVLGLPLAFLMFERTAMITTMGD
ncbi:MAG: hypothetical protein MI924_02340 [Chloroflexales bacterium]|nr:hypothetical protein [Chloroflexales bacterium]